MTSTMSYPNYSPGLEGVVAGITKVSEIDAERSTLQYRGYDVHELAEHGSYEETAYLLLFEKLPTAAELKAFRETLGRERNIQDATVAALRTLPKEAHPMEALRTAFSIEATFDPDHSSAPKDREANLRKSVRMVAKAGTMVAANHRVTQGKDPIKPDPALSTAENFLYQMSGDKPDDYTAKVMDASLTLYAEHGFNASTFACRVCVATLSDLYSGVIAGISTLKGALHGGANEAAMRMMLEIGSAANAESWVRDAIANKKLIMGFGHREYKKGDSRAAYMTKIAKEIGRVKGNTTYGDIADVLERVMLNEKGLYPNVDFPTGYAYYLLGLPIPLYTPIFVMSRVAGYCAHAIEQLDNNRLIRPTAIYEGAHNLPYVPLAQR